MLKNTKKIEEGTYFLGVWTWVTHVWFHRTRFLADGYPESNTIIIIEIQ